MISEADILRALCDVLDPEMPINIVDLGLVEGIGLEATKRRSDAATERGEQGTADGEQATVRVDILPTFVGCPALDMIRDDICKRLLELSGIEHVNVRFLNNPLWSTDRISEAGRASLKEHGVTVPATRRADGATAPSEQSPDRKGAGDTPTARADHGRLGSAAPPLFVPLTISRPDEPAACPFCDSTDTVLESRFGPTRCRMIYYCPSCKNSFERLKRI